MASVLKNLSFIGQKTSRITSLTNQQKNVFTDIKGAQRNVNLRVLKDRIGAVSTVKKITQVMKVLTQQRIATIQRNLFQTRTALEGPNRLWEDQRVDLKGKKNVFVVISSDKGMCGGINAATFRFARDLLKERVDIFGIEPSIISLGELATRALVKNFPQEVKWHASQFSKQGISFAVASHLAERVMNSGADVMTLVYNTYINQISYELTTRDIVLPNGLKDGNANFFNNFEFAEGSTLEHSVDVHEYTLATILYQAMAENGASENAARLLAMDGAAKNASDLSKTIERQYNKARQTKITTELLEIVSGAMFTPKR